MLICNILYPFLQLPKGCNPLQACIWGTLPYYQLTIPLLPAFNQLSTIGALMGDIMALSYQHPRFILPACFKDLSGILSYIYCKSKNKGTCALPEW